jgi:hypothetical protein
MDMRKYLLMFAFILPLMAQEVEVKEVDGKTEVTVKKQHDKKGDWNRGDMRRGGMDQRKKRMAMAKRNKMHKKRAIRSFVRIVVIGGIAYYVGYHQGEKHYKGGWDRKPPMGERK